ncbi:hypothetical protein NQ534_02045 [Marvinbryantia formatexigens DSM 14469]|uniref:hypothetical protein n=3 Tax=Marvinbryantia formatexigens TaxID=168384 RepID=UPI0021A6A1E4|nr:hypothetical protein [Marvinbryantia formatexigens]UWO25298.1 hypothetical protein NQ534_02045 [Marvinbryantia formatexigens DSM 14469]
MVTRQIVQKQEDDTEIVLDFGAEAKNVVEDTEHQFVTAAEKQALQTNSESVQAVMDRIGAADDTGGSETAGTVMGKLNKLISDLVSHMTAWTATRAGYIDTIKTDVAAVKTDVAEAKNGTDEIKTSTDRIGAADDTGGSETAGTVMGKLNKLISDLVSHMTAWTATRAGYIDTIKTDVAAVKTDVAEAKNGTDEIKTSTDRIGAADDTGGSETAGTVMGKLNKLISDLVSHMTAWTATRAGYIDTIKTDAEAAKSSTAVNNTGSATGTLSQKLTHVIELLTSGDVGNRLDELVAKGAVKSVQRGIATTINQMNNQGNTDYYTTVNIGTINPEKSIVLLESAYFQSAILLEVGSSSIKIGTDTEGTAVSWQVIEFY